MSEHLFLKTNRTKARKFPMTPLTIFRCEKCESEVAFPSTMSEGDVNRAVELKWSKFICIPIKKPN
jgi:uncharacterized protein YlaI